MVIKTMILAYWKYRIVSDALVEVFNRWGDRVFAAKNTNAGSANGNYEENHYHQLLITT